MRTALWETSAGALAALLNSGAPLEKCDLYTITLASGQVLRWTNRDGAVKGNGQMWSVGPGITRSKCKWKTGTEVDTLSITLTTDEARPVPIAGLPLLAFIANRGFARARVQLDRAFWTLGDTAPRGALLWFAGAVADVPQVDRLQAQLSIKSDLQLLNIQVPREVYQAQCLRTVYDTECLADPAAFRVSGAATGASTLGRTQFQTNLSQAAGYFDLGTLTFTSGANSGVSRSVKSHPGGLVTVLSPLSAPVAIGDTFTVVPGCDGLETTCISKFNNRIHFKGYPFIPAPETVL
ncbi:MAG: hypothetical protein SHS37scaffold296_11 [Burkholderiales phage 68_11]|jgi:uncharacterized phage protein (TIGR02218 family)|nr:MAG: hypothetical protein SHS37scaffold296_11 [Burkholderiales phage 68_11]